MNVPDSTATIKKKSELGVYKQSQFQPRQRQNTCIDEGADVGNKKMKVNREVTDDQCVLRKE